MRKDERFWQEGMDGKRLVLCLFRRLRLIAAAGLLGAAASAGLYLLAAVVLAGPPEYQVFSQYRIYFDSEKYGQIEDYYNAYTWGEIMKTDEVLDFVLEALPEGITKEQVKASVSVGAMNDVKIMPLYITTRDPALSETIAEAYVYGLDRFGIPSRGWTAWTAGSWRKRNGFPGGQRRRTRRFWDCFWELPPAFSVGWFTTAWTIPFIWRRILRTGTGFRCSGS